MASAVSASSWRFRGRGARARTSEPEALHELERHEGGAFGERFERPWGEQWAEGPEVSVNLHWWSRRSELQHLVEAKTKNCGCDGNKDSRNDGTIELNLSEPYR